MASVALNDVKVHSDAWTGPMPPEFEAPDAGDDGPAWIVLGEGSPMFGPDDAPGIPVFPFAAWIEVQASAIRAKGSNAAVWLAGRLDALAETARFLAAETPDEFDAREAIVEEDARDTQRAIGWSEAERRFEPSYPLF